MPNTSHTSARDLLKKLAAERILVLDGAMGTMIQDRNLEETDFRGGRFASHGVDLKGNNDILCLTRPDIVADLHDQYYAAGADISETNTFSATSIGQGEYAQEAAVRDINLAGARIAREVADRWTAKEPHKPRFVAGSIGPGTRLPSLGQIGFDALQADYEALVDGLLAGGAAAREGLALLDHHEAVRVLVPHRGGRPLGPVGRVGGGLDGAVELEIVPGVTVDVFGAQTNAAGQVVLELKPPGATALRRF